MIAFAGPCLSFMNSLHCVVIQYKHIHMYMYMYVCRSYPVQLVGSGSSGVICDCSTCAGVLPVSTPPLDGQCFGERLHVCWSAVLTNCWDCGIISVRTTHTVCQIIK